MKKNGFTLIELLAVIIILAVIALIATPIILNVIDDSKKSADQSNVAYYANALELKLAENYLANGGSYTSDVDSIVNSTTTNGKKPENCEVKFNNGLVLLRNCEGSTGKYSYANKKVFGMSDTNQSTEFENIWNGVVTPPINQDYTDKSGANKPEVDNGLVPVLYNGTDWVVADTTKKWYDYNNKEWANAIIVKTDKKAEYVANKVVLEDDVLAYYVWIPKYEYKVNGKEQEISVNFKKSTDEVVTTDYIMHPAFTFGTTKLNGIWVGKFELTGDTTTPTVKPNITSLTNQTVSSFFTTIQKIGNYGLDNVDSHMMKNIEWGSVAYLSHSIYGINGEITINNINTAIESGYAGTITGCAGDTVSAAMVRSITCPTNNRYNTEKGVKASTTGNITGIYDMSGGTWEYVMGNYNGTIGNSGFSTMPNAKYFDNYTTSIGIKGDATNADGTNSWYDDYVFFVNTSSSWFDRGSSYDNGINSGVFSFSYRDGNANTIYSSRPVITRP